MGVMRIGAGLVALTMLLGRGGAPVVAQAESAVDGRTLAGETLETQTRFRAVWGERAFSQWTLEHNAELRTVARSTTQSPTIAPTGTPTATPISSTMPTVGATATPTTIPISSTTPTATPLPGMLTIVGGRGPAPEPADEHQLKALGAPLMSLREIATTPDGSIYVSGRLGVLHPSSFVRGDGILRIDPAGFVHTVVGPSANSGDGGRAVDALLTPSGAAHDAMYGLIVADLTHGVRHIDVSGTIRTLVATAPGGQCERRRAPTLCSAFDVAISPEDGTLFIADPTARAIYRLGRGGPLELVTQMAEPPRRLALGPRGSLYVATPDRVVRVNPEDGSSQTIAGSGERPRVGVGDVAGDGGAAIDARIGLIASLAVVPDGTLYLVDDTLRRVRRVGPDGIIHEFTLEGASRPNSVRSVATGPDGALYVGYSDEILRVAADGSISQVATEAQFAPVRNRTYYNDWEGVAFISSMAFASDGTLFAVDSGRGRIQRVALDGSADHIAGAAAALQPGTPPLNRRPERIDHLLGGIDGSVYFRADDRAWRLAPDGKLSELMSRGTYPLAIGQDGSLYYISDTSEGGLRRRAVDGTIHLVPGFYTVFSGSTSPVTLGATGRLALGEDGSVYSADVAGKLVWRVKPDGTASVVYRGDLTFIAVGPHNRLFVSATGFVAGDWSRVDAVNPDGSVIGFAGTGVSGDEGDGGPASAALVDQPAGLLAAADGSLLLVDSRNNRVRRVAPDGTINTLAGLDYARPDGPLSVSPGFREPIGLAVASDGSVLVADSGTYRVRRIGPDGSVSTFAGTGSNSTPIGEPPARMPARSAIIRTGAVALSNDGSAYLTTDRTILKERKIVYHLVDGDLVREAAPVDVVGVALDAGQQLFVVGNNVVARRAKDGTWTTIAGQDHAGYNGDEIPAANAELKGPLGVAVGLDGSLVIADTGNHRLRRITPDGRIHTLAGTGQPGYSGDEGPATMAELDTPSAVSVAADGSVFVADSHNHRVRRVTPDGIIRTVAGTGWAGDGPDRQLAVQVDLNNPMGLAIGPDGSLYIADTGNGRVRRLWGAAPRT